MGLFLSDRQERANTAFLCELLSLRLKDFETPRAGDQSLKICLEALNRS